MDVQPFGAIQSTTDLAVLIPMETVGPILMRIGQQRQIAMELTPSRTMHPSGATKTTMALVAMQKETTRTIVQTKQALQLRIATVAPTEMATGTPTQATHSLTMLRSGKILMATTTETIRTETILTSSQTIHHNGVIPMVTATETIQVEPTVIASQPTHCNGPMLTTMDMETTLSMQMEMESLKATLTYVHRPMENQTQQFHEDVLIPMVMDLPTLKMHSLISLCNGPTKMAMDSVTTFNSPTVTSALRSMERVRRMVSKGVLIPMVTVMRTHSATSLQSQIVPVLMHSRTTHYNGVTKMAMVLVTTTK